MLTARDLHFHHILIKGALLMKIETGLTGFLLFLTVSSLMNG